jgi:hypothetical protein
MPRFSVGASVWARTFQWEAACWRLGAYIHSRSVASDGAVASKLPPTCSGATPAATSQLQCLALVSVGASLLARGLDMHTRSIACNAALASKLAPTGDTLID